MEQLKLDPEAVSSQPSTDELQRQNSRKSLILRCQRILFAAYRTDQYADPDGFVTSLGAVFEQYPNEVLTYVTDPRTGVQRGSVFPPTIAEIVRACDARLGELAQRRRYQNWGKSESRLAIEDKSTRPTYDDLIAKYGKNFGLGAVEEEARTAAAVPAPTAEQLRHHYAHYGLGFKPKGDDAP
jgi:hypothetical protein